MFKSHLLRFVDLREVLFTVLPVIFFLFYLRPDSWILILPPDREDLKYKFYGIYVQNGENSGMLKAWRLPIIMDEEK